MDSILMFNNDIDEYLETVTDAISQVSPYLSLFTEILVKLYSYRTFNETDVIAVQTL